VQLMGSGTILREVIAAAELLEDDWGVERRHLELPELQRTAPRRHGRRALEPAASPEPKSQESHVEQCLEGNEGSGRRATDYMRCSPSRSGRSCDRRYVVLGTDGFGRSDTREQAAPLLRGGPLLRRVAALKALADEGTIPAVKVAEAIRKYGSTRRSRPMAV
jgi:pyruvate dehydrogenase E1 component